MHCGNACTSVTTVTFESLVPATARNGAEFHLLNRIVMMEVQYNYNCINNGQQNLGQMANIIKCLYIDTPKGVSFSWIGFCWFHFDRYLLLGVTEKSGPWSLSLTSLLITSFQLILLDKPYLLEKLKL